VSNPDPTALLVYYLRDAAQLKATRIGCGEGGCGSCTVVLSWKDAASGTGRSCRRCSCRAQQREFAWMRGAGATMYEPANACLRPLCSMDGYNVITAEGIGSKAAGYHPVQSALAKANGVQCGFCSVG
jgi:xanthine dehydrogenase iron-sulfur cluster and FAD-binding subunit A